MKFNRRTALKGGAALLAAAAAGVSPLSVFADEEDSALVGRWRMRVRDGVVRDLSGQRNDGRIGGVQPPPDGWDVLAFGAGGYIRVHNSNALEPAAMTVEAVVKASTTGRFRYLVAKGAQDCLAASYALYTGTSGGLFFYVSNGNDFTLSPDAGAGIWDGRWHRVRGTYNGTSVRLWVDGQEIGHAQPTTVKVAYNLLDDRDLLIARYGTNCVPGFSGDMKEVSIWSRAPEDDGERDHQKQQEGSGDGRQE